MIDVPNKSFSKSNMDKEFSAMVKYFLKLKIRLFNL